MAPPPAPAPMPLKVGELARSCGLTVRTLHHYDEIGLLRPSARSESGYRLYGPADIERLHAIQALRHLGLPLAEIGPLLDGAHAAPEVLLEQQIQALDEQIRRATALRERFTMLRDGLLRGHVPDVGEWVRSLRLMATYGRYFSNAELKAILLRWRDVREEWDRLLVEVRHAMDDGGAIDDPAVQLLARRWMALMHRWMDGDFERIDRWGQMYRREPSAHGVASAPPTDMLEFMERAITLRLQALQRHFGPEKWRSLRLPAEARWQAIEARGRALLDAPRPPAVRAARALARRWLALLDDAAGGDAELRARMLVLHEGDPLLMIGSPVSADVRRFLLEQVRALDPHAT